MATKANLRFLRLLRYLLIHRCAVFERKRQANKKRVFPRLTTRLALWLKPKLGGASDKQIKNEFFRGSPLGLHFGCAQVRRRLGQANKKRGFFFTRHSACTLAEAQVRRRLGQANKKRVFSLLATRLALWLRPS